MSRRKDREKFQRIQALYPAYKGYRGPEEPPPSKAELKALVCTKCGRKRNVPVDTPEEAFVCSFCKPEEIGEATAGGPDKGK